MAKRESLHEAARNGDLALLARLLHDGARVSQRDTHQRMAVHMASWAGQLRDGVIAGWTACKLKQPDSRRTMQNEALQALLAAGAEPRAGAMDDMNTLHFAAQNGHAETCKLLLEAGVRIDSRNRKGQSALHIAAQRGHPELVTYLLKRRAAPDAKNRRDLTPSDVAATDEIRDLLSQAILERQRAAPHQEALPQSTTNRRPNVRKRTAGEPVGGSERHPDAGESTEPEATGGAKQTEGAPAKKAAKVSLSHLGDDEEE